MSRDRTEPAILVLVEFTGERRRSSLAAKMAKSAAALGAESDSGLRADYGTAEPPLTAEKTEVPLSGEADEFAELATSAGAQVVAILHQKRARPDPATLVGVGKLAEIEGVLASSGAKLVLFDHDLSPSQLRNLEERLPSRIIDRTQLILDIFARRARTREGQLQVELAQLEYQLPRLAGRGLAMSQLGGGIGTRGPGETQLETDRRKINLRIDHVKEELDSVRRIRKQQRQRREGIPVPVVALVGYTNAGKSTLFNALTGAGVLESARMFATLDTKLRQLRLPSRRKVLLSDTVGFIRNLPHTLITSFRATLEEVERAELLLHVQDASSPSIDEQRTQVDKVLAELEISDKPVINVLNKIDLIAGYTPNQLPADTVAVSGREKLGLDALLLAIDEALTEDPLVEANFRFPQSEGRIMATLEAGAVIEDKRFEGNLAYVHVIGPVSLLSRYRRFQQRDPAEQNA